MLQNIWNKTKIVCACHGEEYPEMSIRPGVGNKSMFYACPKYYPENREKGEVACVNHINDVEMEKILKKISSEASEQMQFGQSPFLMNYSFKIKDIEVKVVSQTDDELKVAVKNRKALI